VRVHRVPRGVFGRSDRTSTTGREGGGLSMDVFSKNSNSIYVTGFIYLFYPPPPVSDIDR